MPLHYSIEGPVVRFLTRGDVDYEEGLDVLGNGLAEACGRDDVSRWSVLFDIRDSSEQRSTAELRAIADRVAETLGPRAGRCAIVASDAFRFGQGRMFGAFGESRGMQVWVFRDLPAAEAWLDGGPAPG